MLAFDTVLCASPRNWFLSIRFWCLKPFRIWYQLECIAPNQTLLAKLTHNDEMAGKRQHFIFLSHSESFFQVFRIALSYGFYHGRIPLCHHCLWNSKGARKKKRQRKNHVKRTCFNSTFCLIQWDIFARISCFCIVYRMPYSCVFSIVFIICSQTAFARKFHCLGSSTFLSLIRFPFLFSFKHSGFLVLCEHFFLLLNSAELSAATTATVFFPIGFCSFAGDGI